MSRILVIEDDSSFLNLLRVHLTRAGYTVQTALDAALGLRAILENPPELIVFDINLPDLDGFEFLEALRSDPVSANIPVVIVTGRNDDETYAQCLEMGFKDYFTKPVQSEALIKAIDARLRERQAPRR